MQRIISGSQGAVVGGIHPLGYSAPPGEEICSLPSEACIELHQMYNSRKLGCFWDSEVPHKEG